MALNVNRNTPVHKVALRNFTLLKVTFTQNIRASIYPRVTESNKENMDISSTSSSSSSSSDEEIIVLLNDERRRKRRRFWVHPIVTRREEHGEFYRLVQELKMYHERFRGYFRMSVSEFENLLQQLAPSLTKEQTHYRKPIDPEQRLAVCLRFLSTGDSYRTIASSFRLGVSTVASIVSETCDALWDCLRDEHLPVPTEEMWRSTARRFHERWNFPNCLGAMDGKHICIQAPANSGSLYFNYKGTFSVVLLALVDADYRFLVVDVGSYGSNSDGGIFANSGLGKALRDGTLNVPPPSELPGAPELGKVNHVIVADEAFPLKTYLLRPYPGRRLPTDKRIFNYRLSRARRISENVFGILSQRFRVFQRTLQVQSSVVDKVVKAACVLCNYLRPKGEDHNHATEDDHECEQPLQGFEHCRGQRASFYIHRNLNVLQINAFF
uniref:DDE Tnp4 domain-containing protein n=1 Tax=Oryzias latipes TaxID=8090 RepID=A0A3P9LF24_ORYLA